MRAADDVCLRVNSWRGIQTGLVRRLELTWALTIDELKRTYGESVVGLCWIVVKPLMLIALYTVLFGFVFRSRVGGEQTSAEYVLVLLSGLLPWQMFADSVTAATGAISSNAGLVTKILFPIDILPVSKVVCATMTGLVGLAVFVVAVIVLHHAGWTIVLLPLLLGAQLLFTLGLAWMLSAFNVAVRDTSQVLPFVLTIGMFLSPVVYTASMVPAPLAAVFTYNPMAYFLDGYRAILLANQAPPTEVWLVAIGLSGTALVGGGWVFGRMRLFMADSM